MRRLRATALMLPLLISCALLAAGCGDDGGAAAPGRSDPADAPKPGTPEAIDEKSGARAFADTPELQACMNAAGFAEDAPTTGGLKAWRHDSGARAVVGSGPEVTNGIASEIGTAQAPADVDGTVVLSGPQAQRDAAAACLL